MDTIEPEHIQVDLGETLMKVMSGDTMNKKDLKNKGNKTIHLTGKKFKRQHRLTSYV